MPIQAPTRGQPFYGYSEKVPHFNRLSLRASGYRGHILVLNPMDPKGFFQSNTKELKRSITKRRSVPETTVFNTVFLTLGLSERRLCSGKSVGVPTINQMDKASDMVVSVDVLTSPSCRTRRHVSHSASETSILKVLL